MFIKICLLFVLYSVSTSAEKFRFNNYTVYKISPRNVEQVKLLQNLHDFNLKFDFWNEPLSTAQHVTVLTSPENKKDLDKFLSENHFSSEIMTENIQADIDKERVKKYIKGNTRSMEWDAYYELNDINNWLFDLIATHSEASEINGGVSFEGRPIKGIKISHGNGRRAIFIEAGIHAREWISPATANFIIKELLTSNEEPIKAAARDFDWYIFPVCNPDGYIWSHEDFRMWRKNRRPIGEHFGVDLNRNWDNNWGLLGASTNPASDTYAGSAPFSEPETRTLSNFIADIAQHIDIYLSFHAFGQMLLLPFGNSTDPQANYHEAVNIGRRAMGALSVRDGTQYVTGNVAEVIYHATGGSIDWVKEDLKIPLVYCYELRDRSTFLLPSEQILPTVLETMDSVIDMIYQGRRFGLLNSSSKLSNSLFGLMLMFFAKYLM